MLMPIRSNSKLTQKAEADMSSILGWLWDVAVCPIPDALGFPKPSMDDEWPRVWWIAAGELSSFPLHDAGRHTSSSTDSAIDRVISSYSPSVRAFLHARRQSRKASDSMHDQALLVSMATTARCFNLSFAKREMEKRESLLPASMEKVKLEQPCSDDVLKGVSDRYSVKVAEKVYKPVYDPRRVSDDASVSMGVHNTLTYLRDITRPANEKKYRSRPESKGVKDRLLYVLSWAGPVILRLQSRDAEGDKTIGKRKRSDSLIWAAYIHVEP